MSIPEYEWDRTVENLPETHELASAIKKSVWETEGGHAYKEKTIREIMRITKVDQDVWPFEEVRKMTDQLAIIVGLHVATENRMPIGKRVKYLTDEMSHPTKSLINAFDSCVISREFRSPYSTFSGFDFEQFQTLLAEFDSCLDAHINKLNSFGGSGKNWKSELMQWHCRCCDMLLEKLGTSVLPGRLVEQNDDDNDDEHKSTFENVVEELGKSFRWAKTKELSENEKFDGAIRVFVNDWNKRFQELTGANPRTLRRQK